MFATDTIAAAFDWLADLCFDTYLSIRELPLLGDWLGSFFITAFIRFIDLKYATRHLGLDIVALVNSIPEALSWDSIRERIVDHFPFLGDFWGYVDTGIEKWLFFRLDDFVDLQRERLYRIGERVINWAWD